MNFEATTSTQYFLPEQQMHLQAFEDSRTEVGVVYENNGEKRHVLRIWLPVGWINKHTVYYKLPDQFGNRAYHTPLATLTETKFARVAYMNPDTGDGEVITSDKWLEWLGSTPKASKPKSQPKSDFDKQIEKQKKIMLAKDKAKVSGEKYDDETKISEEANWKPIKRKRG